VLRPAQLFFWAKFIQECLRKALASLINTPTIGDSPYSSSQDWATPLWLSADCGPSARDFQLQILKDLIKSVRPDRESVRCCPALIWPFKQKILRWQHSHNP
jgi:hypothetical protein